MGPTYRFKQKKYSRNSEKLDVTKWKKKQSKAAINATLKEFMKKQGWQSNPCQIIILVFKHHLIDH